MTKYIWEKSYPENIKWNAKIKGEPLYRLLDDSAAKFPDNEMVDFMGKIYSYSQILDMVDRAAEGFKNLGVKKGVNVGIFLPNCPQFIISYFAILKAGGTVVNFSPLYSKSELENQIKDSGVKMMVTLSLKELYSKLSELLGKGDFNKIIVGSLTDALPCFKAFLFSTLKRGQIASFPKDENHIEFSELLKSEKIESLPKINPDKDVAVLQYTGGTTGIPKGAVLTHSNIYINAKQCGLWFTGLEEGEETMLGVLPFFHVFAMTVVMNFSILNAAKIILHPRFEIKKVLKDIEKKKPTLMPGVPTMFTAINNFKGVEKYDLSSLKACFSGGAGLPSQVKKKFEKLSGCKLVEGYGLTESSPVTNGNPIFGENREGSIGLPFPDTIIEIRDIETGKKVKTGEVGELCVKGPQVMKEYWKNKNETKNVLKGGFLHTGDVAKMDEQGYVYIVDRIKELILAGGFNIYPRHVEEAIYKHDSVSEVAVIGVDDQYRGQTVKAVIALKEGEDLKESELKTFLKDHIGKHEMPTIFEFRDELPKTMIGKISKKDLS